MEKKSWKVDVPVYMIFFNRPDTLKMVFDAVKEARPSKLFLACDGAREGRADDAENVARCKEVVSDIDWECEVYTNYSDVNLGCGMRMTSGINWAFEYVDRLIILEDDCVPSQDFFLFCEELLERYKDDERIFMIDAMNHLGEYEVCPYSYFFGPGCCWGWATWKRAWKHMDFPLAFMDYDYEMQCVENLYPYYKEARKIGRERQEVLRAGKKLSSWTFQAGMACALNNQICIVPKQNMVTNVGLTADSAHAVNDIRKVSKRKQAYFNAPCYDVEWPLKHPKYVIEDRMYYEMMTQKFKTTFFSKIEGYARRLVFAEKGDVAKMLKKIPKKLGLKK